MRQLREGINGRWMILTVSMLVAAMPCATASASPETGDDLIPAPPAPSDDFSASVSRDEPSTSPSASALSESKTAYDNLSDAQALKTAKDEFASFLRAELVPELDLPQGSKVGKYLDQHTARVIPESAPDEQVQMVLSGEPSRDLLLESSLPLRAPEQGGLRPLDGDLELDGNHFAADNPIVDAEISKDLDEGATLEQSGVTLAPRQTEPTDAVTVFDKVFYPNAYEDTDYVVTPTATGFGIFIQLRSPDSERSLPLELDTPAGATMHRVDDGSIEIVKGEQIVATIAAPSALDAADQDVPVNYELAGDRLTVEVEPDLAQTLWPIMVDPIVDEYGWQIGNTDPDTRY